MTATALQILLLYVVSEPENIASIAFGSPTIYFRSYKVVLDLIPFGIRLRAG